MLERRLGSTDVRPVAARLLSVGGSLAP